MLGDTRHLPIKLAVGGGGGFIKKFLSSFLVVFRETDLIRVALPGEVTLVTGLLGGEV